MHRVVRLPDGRYYHTRLRGFEPAQLGDGHSVSFPYQCRDGVLYHARLPESAHLFHGCDLIYTDVPWEGEIDAVAEGLAILTRSTLVVAVGPRRYATLLGWPLVPSRLPTGGAYACVSDPTLLRVWDGQDLSQLLEVVKVRELGDPCCGAGCNLLVAREHGVRWRGADPSLEALSAAAAQLGG